MVEIHPVDALLYKERQTNLQSNFQGIAKIYLRHLKFARGDQNAAGDLYLNPKNVA